MDEMELERDSVGEGVVDFEILEEVVIRGDLELLALIVGLTEEEGQPDGEREREGEPVGVLLCEGEEDTVGEEVLLRETVEELLTRALTVLEGETFALAVVEGETLEDRDADGKAVFEIETEEDPLEVALWVFVRAPVAEAVVELLAVFVVPALVVGKEDWERLWLGLGVPVDDAVWVFEEVAMGVVEEVLEEVTVEEEEALMITVGVMVPVEEGHTEDDAVVLGLGEDDALESSEGVLPLEGVRVVVVVEERLAEREREGEEVEEGVL